MKMIVFAVKDRATNMFGTPMFLLSAGQATRSFSDEINRSAADNQLFQHPDDFDLYELGFYDSNDGSFLTHTPELVILGKQCVVMKGEMN